MAQKRGGEYQVEGAESAVAAGIEQLDLRFPRGAVSGNGDACAVGAEAHRLDGDRLRVWRTDSSACGGVEELHAGVAAADDEGPAVRRDVDSAERVAFALYDFDRGWTAGEGGEEVAADNGRVGEREPLARQQQRPVQVAFREGLHADPLR